MKSLDASIGLNKILLILRQYSQTGMLQAEISRLPGIKGSGICSLWIVDGEPVSCFIETKTSEQKSLSPSALARFDKDKGPFDWQFYPQQRQEQKSTTASLPSLNSQRFTSHRSPPTRYAIPHVVANLNVGWLNTWLPQRKRILRMVYFMIDGQRTVEDIERFTGLPPHVVQEALVILIALNIVVVGT